MNHAAIHNVRPPLAFRVTVILFSVLVYFPAPVAAASQDQDAYCGSYPGRIWSELALHRQNVARRARLGYTLQSAPPAPAQDNGNIAVIADDGSMVTPVNLFDLDALSVAFQPAAGSYAATKGGAAFDADAAANGVLLNPGTSAGQSLGDDDSRELPIGFAFPFFGKSYPTVFLNSDGNLTFERSDSASTERSLTRFLAGAPRIAPYFADLDPSRSGRISYLASPDRFVATWTAVPDYSSSGTAPTETFQVTLTPDGGVLFAYNGIRGSSAVVGLSPGGFNGVPALLDFSKAQGDSHAGPLAEVFSNSTKLDLAAVSQRFFQTHQDAYDYLVVFSNFDFDLGGAFAFELAVSNQVTGLGHINTPQVFDFSNEFGGSSLKSLVNMGNLNRFPADPSTIFFRGVDSTLSILGQESGHRFLAYATFDDLNGHTASDALLGRDLQHWSFLFNSDASVMEGNRIQDNGGGSFTTAGAVEHYSDLDQYFMGLRSPAEVGPTFLVANPSPAISPARGPAKGVTFSGQRVDISLDQIVASVGPRVPNALNAPKSFNFGFVLVTPKGASPSSAELAHIDAIRQAWEGFFSQATSSRGTANTVLLPSVRQIAVVNAAGFSKANLSQAPGAIISIFGNNLAASIATASSLPLPASLADTTVDIGGTAAPLYYASPTQINAQIPFEASLAPGALLTVRRSGSVAATAALSLVPAAPGIFSFDSSGGGAGVITHAATHLPVGAQSPAVPLEFVEIFATGLGAVTPAIASGGQTPAAPLYTTALSPKVTMNGVAATVPFAGLAPGFAGLYQVDAQVPASLNGSVEVVLEVNGVRSNAVTMQVGAVAAQ